MELESQFKFISVGLVAAIVVAGLGLITNMVEQPRMIYFIGGVTAFVVAAGLVAFILNWSSANYAERLLRKIADDCDNTLRHVCNEYTSSILRGSIIHDSELDQLERSHETNEIWVVTPLNLDHDVPGKVFFNSLKENLDNRNKNYLYVIRDSERARYNAREIASKILRTDLLRFALLSDQEWHSLPIVGIPVTIHNPNDVDHLRIYISTQQSKDRGQHWAVFSGWTTAQIIERTREVVKYAKVIKTLAEYAELPVNRN